MRTTVPRLTPGRQLRAGRVQSTRQRGGPAADRGLPHGVAGLPPGRHQEHRRRLAQIQAHLGRAQQDERRAGGPAVRADAGGPQRPRRGRVNYVVLRKYSASAQTELPPKVLHHVAPVNVAGLAAPQQLVLDLPTPLHHEPAVLDVLHLERAHEPLVLGRDVCARRRVAVHHAGDHQREAQNRLHPRADHNIQQLAGVLAQSRDLAVAEVGLFDHHAQVQPHRDLVQLEPRQVQRQQLAVVADFLQLLERGLGLENPGLQVFERRQTEILLFLAQQDGRLRRSLVARQLQHADPHLQILELLPLVNDLPVDEEQLSRRALERVQTVLVGLEDLVPVEYLLVRVDVLVRAGQHCPGGIHVVKKVVGDDPFSLVRVPGVLEELAQPAVLRKGVAQLQKNMVPELDVASRDLRADKHEETRCERHEVFERRAGRDLLAAGLHQGQRLGKVRAGLLVLRAEQKHASPRNNPVEHGRVLRRESQDVAEEEVGLLRVADRDFLGDKRDVVVQKQAAGLVQRLCEHVGGHGDSGRELTCEEVKNGRPEEFPRVFPVEQLDELRVGQVLVLHDLRLVHRRKVVLAGVERLDPHQRVAGAQNGSWRGRGPALGLPYAPFGNRLCRRTISPDTRGVSPCAQATHGVRLVALLFLPATAHTPVFRPRAHAHERSAADQRHGAGAVSRAGEHRARLRKRQSQALLVHGSQRVVKSTEHGASRYSNNLSIICTAEQRERELPVWEIRSRPARSRERRSRRRRSSS
ncbi:hypothetical protein KL929_003516 [Ogataea haglerorum]|nr:hypothetical protein KL929_003516 [Ogataea haglerorum]